MRKMWNSLSLTELQRLIQLPIHRPLLLSDVGDRQILRSRMEQGRWKNIMREKLARCNNALKEPINAMPRSLYDDFFKTGRRHLFERPYFQRRSLAEDLALAYILTEKPEYLERCRDYIWAIMEEFTWVVPAHIRLPLRPEDVAYIDLFSSGTALLLADLHDLLHNDLDDETGKWMQHNIIYRVLAPLRDHYDEQWWTTGYQSNWCGVCCGNSGCALILTALEEPWAASLLYKLLKSIDGFLSTADPDGAWVEGAGYWFYGFSHIVYLSDLLAKITDNCVNLLEDPRIRSTATFPVWMYLPPRFQVNFGDTSETPNVYPEVLRRFEALYREPSIAWYVERLKEERLLGGGSLRDLLWASSSDLHPMPPTEEAKWYRQIGVIVTRSSWTDLDAPVLAIKAGHNAEPHNHLDVGQFIYHCYGNSFICDLGAGVYNRDYFGPKRYENPFCGAEGHNLIFVDGRSQAPGREHEGRITEYKRETDWEKIRIDLTKAYPSDLLSEATRTLCFFKIHGLTLVDDVKCSETAQIETRLHFRGTARPTSFGIEIDAEKGRLLVAPEQPSHVRIQIDAHKGLKGRDPRDPDPQYIRLLTESDGGYARIKVHFVPYRPRQDVKARLETLRNLLEQATF